MRPGIPIVPFKMCMICSERQILECAGGMAMEEVITLCGDNCIECPRYNAHETIMQRNAVNVPLFRVIKLLKC